jgi:SNF2 family DNA or RNA helicase
MRLRQAAINPALLLRPLEDEGLFDTDGADLSLAELEVAGLIRGFDVAADLTRLQICKDLALRILGAQGKVLVWSYFLGNLERLKRQFSGLADFVEVLTGATPVAADDEGDESLLPTREAIIDRFHKPGESAILIANPQAVGESISLHRACCSAIYFDRDFNAGRFIQSKDRIHRYRPDTGNAVNYYYLQSSSTVDEDVDARLTAKERRLLDLLDSDDIPLFTAEGEGYEDLEAILRSYERRKTS